MSALHPQLSPEWLLPFPLVRRLCCNRSCWHFVCGGTTRIASLLLSLRNSTQHKAIHHRFAWNYFGHESCCAEAWGSCHCLGLSKHSPERSGELQKGSGFHERSTLEDMNRVKRTTRLQRRQNYMKTRQASNTGREESRNWPVGTGLYGHANHQATIMNCLENNNCKWKTVTP